MIQIPIKAVYRIADGIPSLLHGEYFEISAEYFAELLLNGFGVVFGLSRSDEERGETISCKGWHERIALPACDVSVFTPKALTCALLGISH